MIAAGTHVAGARPRASFRDLVTGQLRLVLEDGTLRVGTVGVLLVFSSLMSMVPVPAGIDPGWLFLVPVAVSAIGSGLREGLLVAVGASLLCALYALAGAGELGAATFLGVMGARLALLGLLAAVLGAFAEAHLAVQSNLRQLATTDPLTRVANVATFYEAMATTAAGGFNFVLVIVDVDDLKVINDRHGHPVGSAAIRSVADALRGSVRGGDCVARFGGDEFVVLLRDADRAGAQIVINRVRHVLAERPLPGAPGTCVSVSAGVAVYGPEGRSTDELLAAADAAMYRNKRERKVSVARG